MSVEEYTITAEDSIEALRNEYRDILEKFNPRYVKVERESAPEGTLCLLKITVNAPTFYLNSEKDTNPKPTDGLTFYVKVHNGFPKVKPNVYYPVEKHLASVNVFRNGTQCIDEWTANSTLVEAVEKTIRDIVHEPVVANYDSMANTDVCEWQKAKTASGAFPTIDMALLYKPETKQRPSMPSMPAQKIGRSRRINSTPPLPNRA